MEVTDHGEDAEEAVEEQCEGETERKVMFINPYYTNYVRISSNILL
ncbi:hypothetical protein ACP26L_18560 [Paenibacillus sp. S-38]